MLKPLKNLILPLVLLSSMTPMALANPAAIDAPGENAPAPVRVQEIVIEMPSPYQHAAEAARREAAEAARRLLWDGPCPALMRRVKLAVYTGLVAGAIIYTIIVKPNVIFLCDK